MRLYRHRRESRAQNGWQSRELPKPGSLAHHGLIRLAAVDRALWFVLAGINDIQVNWMSGLTTCRAPIARARIA